MVFRCPELDESEKRVLDKISQIRDSIKYALRVPVRWFGSLRRSMLARAIQGSNSIEGYNVTLEDAIAAIEGEPLLEASDENQFAITGYRDAMTYVLELARDPHFAYGAQLIRSLHFMMLRYDLRKNPGLWRPGAVYVRDEQKGSIVYEGSAAEAVPGLVDELCSNLNMQSSLPAVIRAAMAHINLVMIHPFSDGNGRMSRCLQTLVLAREGILEPQFCSIEEYLGRNTKEYYSVLAEVGQGTWRPSNDVRPWIRFCLTAHYRQAKTIVRRIEEIKLVSDEVELLVKKEKLHERCMFALLDAARGLRVRNSTYRAIAEISENLASRDLKTMVDRGLLVSIGDTRSRIYLASEALRQIRLKNRRPTPIQDPFREDPKQVLMSQIVSTVEP
jgi:Fic family protein